MEREDPVELATSSVLNPPEFTDDNYIAKTPTRQVKQVTFTDSRMIIEAPNEHMEESEGEEIPL